jgi:ATP-dependent helicase STH1/SNF2
MKVLDITEDFLKSQSWNYLRLDGGTRTEECASHMTAFNTKDSPIQVFTFSTRAGGLGLNLQTADTVIIFDSIVIYTWIFRRRIVRIVLGIRRLSGF